MGCMGCIGGIGALEVATLPPCIVVVVVLPSTVWEVIMAVSVLPLLLVLLAMEDCVMSPAGVVWQQESWRL
ncbi:hypothetical protein COO60DRAFT_1539016, partial [Scenedesmus sp. NREL 46B-D3]